MKGTVTIVTGGAKGIGRAIALFLAEKGGDVAIFDVLDGSDTANDVKNMGRNAIFCRVDVSDWRSVEDSVDYVFKEMKRIDNLVNNAGITQDRLLVRMKEEDWERVMSVNLKGVFNCTKAVLKYMIKTGGAIVNISSIAGIMGNAGQANYAASKAGIIGFTKSVAKEYADRNIRVNAIAPGFIKTDMTNSLNEKIKEEMIRMIPLKRPGEPIEVAKVVYFLLSEYSSYITGEVINVSGGLYM
ncbi:MAG: 3-oxoacyl-[acyl-carrier-protein] reductase [Desulfobacterota bacterium]|nr:3-oxoacyl-[acyl-carrier-protein] reductase [Thermodesulfobacteriota bacterium]MDW8002489.1 3-oxoacyl-[acyl-carrier-protein] reductase [Deltaproteobacteria bacterium]